jgi:hypothetical protein
MNNNELKIVLTINLEERPSLRGGCSQIINMTKEAYDYMISNKPNRLSNKEWNALNLNQKLEAHFKITSESLSGKSFTYKVM